MKDRKKALSQEDVAQIQLGEARLVTIAVTAAFGSGLARYYFHNGYCTHVGSGKHKISQNTYTLSYSIKVYTESGKAYISAGGSSAGKSFLNERTKANFNKPKQPLIALYLYIVKRFPSEVLWVEWKPEDAPHLHRS